MDDTAETPQGRDLSDAAHRIIAAVETLLVDQPLEAVTVADIMAVAGVARGTFYLWFSSKYDVVVQAHRQVLANIVADVAGFLERRDADEESLRAALASFVETWRSHGPVLAASAEIWRSQPDLGREWQANMQLLVDGVAARLAAVPLSSPGVDPEAVAHALIWMNERTAYMAAAGLAPVGLDDGLVDALTFVWSAVLRRGPISP